ncbi:MAG: terminase family protein [Gemmatimonadota bacterium]|nr:terminase family protein [Gemmatimonadota bacterium]
MTQANHLPLILQLAHTFHQQAQNTGQDAYQLAQEWIAALTDTEIEDLWYDWKIWARPDQLPPPGDWRWWLILGGRGSGKTRTGAEFILQKEREGCQYMALVGKTEADVRKIMVEGPSGILACAPPDNRPKYYSEKRELIWPSGAKADTYFGDSFDQLRGPGLEAAWIDELAKFRTPKETFENLRFGLRMDGGNRIPQCVITTTPRPLTILRDLLKDKRCVPTQMSTSANKAHLADMFIEDVEELYKGTRLGRQELEGQLLKEVRGALWKLERIEETRITRAAAPDYQFVVIGVDPQGNKAQDAVDRQFDDDEGSETGIVVCGKGFDGRGYVLEDASGDYDPNQWSGEAVATFIRHRASLIVAESNQGGEMVRATLLARDPHLPVELVRATDNKKARALPISIRYEEGEVSHVGTFELLEDEMISYTGQEKRSPSRLDALVWALTALFDPKNDYRSRSHYDFEAYEIPPQKTKRRQPHPRGWLGEFYDSV